MNARVLLGISVGSKGKIHLSTAVLVLTDCDTARRQRDSEPAFYCDKNVYSTRRLLYHMITLVHNSSSCIESRLIYFQISNCVQTCRPIFCDPLLVLAT